MKISKYNDIIFSDAEKEEISKIVEKYHNDSEKLKEFEVDNNIYHLIEITKKKKKYLTLITLEV